MQKVVITGNVGVVTPEIFDRYKKYITEEVPGTEVEFLADLAVSDEEMIEGSKGATVIVSQFQNMNEKIYKALAPELKAFVAHGIGTNAANVKVATENDILVSNVPDYCLEEVANHAVTLLLASYRNVCNSVDFVKAGNWKGGHQSIIHKKRFSEYTVGLFGFGNIPRKVAEMLSGFGVKIISSDPFVSAEDMSALGVTKVSFDELLEQSDFLSLHAPLVASTENVFNKEAFKKMKKTAHLINTARGGLVNPEDLYNALKNKDIEFAALDVLIAEPPSGMEKELIGLDNTLLTPHVSYYSSTAFDELIDKIGMAVVAILKGEKPVNVVNKDVLPRLTWLKD